MTSAVDPVSVTVNVDAALLLQTMVGIDAYPSVLALTPNIYDDDDRDRVHKVVLGELVEAGVIEDDRVHPAITGWLECLYRPDVELVARIVDTGRDESPQAMLRMSFVRRGESTVLAVRSGDEVVFQTVYHPDRELHTLAAVVVAAMGSNPALSFAPMTATLDEFTEVPPQQDERRQALLELGAPPHTASVLSRVLDEVTRRAEIVMFEYHDGTQAQPRLSLSVLDTPSGRIVVTPRVAMDGTVWSTYAPGDDAAVHAGVAALVELLPGRSWFDTSRTD
ncbi:ESX secretion-associated protein EspG [Nocardia callitridis]|uniref:ESX secretion-associated protein EspG n=1 Tax=Nocardia callitridis TaxID=648753 RepID=UPI0031EC2B5A